MINNPALDVAIGLIFIYALYSLIATTLTELIATWISLRGRMLRKGIIRMLDDKNPRSKLGSLLKTMNDDSKDKLSNRFLNRPEILYLGKGKTWRNRESMPSYIKAKTFAKGLINALDGNQDPAEILKTLEPKEGEAQSKTNEFIINLINESNSDLDRFKSLAEDWFNETMDRVIGWYKKRTQLITFIIGLFIAFSMGVDTIQIGKKLSHDKKARLAMVEAASGYANSFEFYGELDSENLKKIEQLTERVDSILVTVQEAETVMETGAPEDFGLIKKQKNRKESWLYILGCFLTAIALSVGSPFWFDLLNRLVKLRGAGTQESINSKNAKNQPVG